MADYYLQFSCIFYCGTDANATAADTIRAELAVELDRDEGESLGFEMEVAHEDGAGALWLYSEDYGEPEHVIRFALRCAEAFTLRGQWGFTWSYSCSKPRCNEFGGGAVVIDLERREVIEDLDCLDWVQALVNESDSGYSATPAIAAGIDTSQGGKENQPR